jgi:hypothetical protein
MAGSRDKSDWDQGLLAHLREQFEATAAGIKAVEERMQAGGLPVISDVPHQKTLDKSLRGSRLWRQGLLTQLEEQLYQMGLAAHSLVADGAAKYTDSQKPDDREAKTTEVLSQHVVKSVKKKKRGGPRGKNSGAG